MDRYDNDRLIMSRCATLLRSLFDAIRQSVVETDPASVTEFRHCVTQQIALLGTDGALTDEAAAWRLTTEVSNAMRDYARRANVYVRKIRDELETTAKALDSILRQTQGSRSEQRLDEEVGHLRSALAARDPESLKLRVSSAVEGISECVEQLRREKNVVVAQLQDEIRLLHQIIDDSRRAAETDPVTGVLRREDAIKAIRRDLAAGRPVGIVQISIANFAGLATVHSPAMIERVLTAVCKRLAEAIPQAARIVRWQKDSLSVVLPPALVNDIESDAVRACAGDYICMDDGSRRNLYVEAAAAGLCSQPGEDADEFLARLDHIRIPAAAQTRGPI